MLIDFRKYPPPVPYLEIVDKIVKRVEVYKYLGTVINSCLSFNKNVDAIHRKCQPRLYCLHKPRNIGIDSKILQAAMSLCSQFRSCAGMEACVFKVSVFWVMWWICAVKLWMWNKWECKNVPRRALKKARQMSNDESHVLAQCYELPPYGRRFRNFGVKARTKRSFISCSIKLLDL